MKKKGVIWGSVLVIVALCISIPLTVYAFDDRYVEYEKLPASIKQFVSAHFPDAELITASKDFPEYSVWIGQNIEIDFNFRREWDEISCKSGEAIPASILALIPANIHEYINKNFDGAVITKISRERRGYEIGISNRNFELFFNKNGQLTGIDD